MLTSGSSDLTEKSRPRIQRLPSDLVNQIAAGEVVERPANLIKELVENSLDAGATRIEVHLFEGGLKELTVIDDGCGICEEDLPLAVERHTTSKLKSLEDLERIATFGFRGEALSSIASVSDFSIRSRTQKSERGMALHVPYGEPSGLKPVGCPQGTQVCVKELFSRLPARFKFLRSQATELSHCVKLFKELALGNPEVSFFLHHNGRLLLKYTSESRLGRLKECLKPDWDPIHLKDSIEEMAYEAFLSPPNWAQERGELTLFINRRPVKNRLLLSSIKNSFAEILGPQAELSGTFYLDIRGDWVDVNVHPQKLEVRFYRQERIYSWLLTSLRKQLPALGYKNAVSTTMASEPEFSQPALFNKALPLRFIGVLGSSLLLVEKNSDLFILNRIALEKRRLFFEQKKSLETTKGKSRSLPLAEILPLPAHLQQPLQGFLPELNQLGFELDFFGDNDLAIKAVPAFFPDNSAKEAFSLFLTCLNPGLAPQPERLDFALKKLIELCVPRQPMENSWESIQSLLSSFTELDESWTCPEGNPVLFKISWQQLENHFKNL